MKHVYNQLGKLKILPVATLTRSEDAVPLVEALTAGGLPGIEVMFRSDAAEASIREIAGKTQALVGAGTVLNVETARRAIDAGAAFIVSPGTNPKVVEFCLQQGMPIVPGVVTPTDIEMALSLGVDVLKFFPAEAYGGTRTLAALAGPYKQVRFIPTGGIGPANLNEYLAIPSVLACGGSWIAKPDMIANGKFDQITELTREAVRLAGHTGS